METLPLKPLNTTRPTHPLLLVAAASVTALSFAGVGMMAGWLPGPAAHNGRLDEAAVIAKATTPPASVSIQQTFNAPQAKPAAAVSKARTRPVSATRSSPVATTPAPVAAAPRPAPVICSDCGIVAAVNEVAIEGKPSGGGAMVGGVLGGLAGNQVGAGSGKDLATLVGIFGGAIAGHHIEKNMKETRRYDVVVRFEDGRSRTFSSETSPIWQSGDRVKLENDALTRRDTGLHGADDSAEHRTNTPTALLGSID